MTDEPRELNPDGDGEPKENAPEGVQPAGMPEGIPVENWPTSESIAAGRKELEAELTKTQNQAQEYLDGWKRSQAEFANYRRRIEREQSQVYQNAAGSLIKRYLGAIDDLERALKVRPREGEGAAWADGIELIYRKLLQILESEGVKPMDAAGQQFDPNLHEAVVSEDSPDHESGQIIEVLQQGYLIGDRVLRPAMVRVAR